MSAPCFSAVTPPEAVAEKPSSFHYNRQGKIDPFKPLIRKETAVVKKHPEAALSPLQRYGIDQFRLIGIMSGEDKTVAIVSDPVGKSYVISKGTWIGQNKGRVAEILGDQVIVEERTGEDSRKINTRKIILNLHRVESGEKL